MSKVTIFAYISSLKVITFANFSLKVAKSLRFPGKVIIFLRFHI